jgi:DNA-binding CsgD family transcriptional regulator
MNKSIIRDYLEYKLYFEFIKKYSSTGFKGIERNDPLILSLEEMTKTNNQFFCVFDMLRMNVDFTSQRSIQMLGINPEDLTPYNFKEATHPDDLKRHELALLKLFKTAHEIYVAKRGVKLISSDFRLRNLTGNYTNQLIQCYLFYNPAPYETVFLLNINTDIDWWKKLNNRYHYYFGDDLSFFKYPDKKLLMEGIIFSDREFEIIKLIHEGLESEEIAKKLFLSKHTINTHRKNILNKTGKTHFSDLVFYLEEQGLL